MVDFQMVDRRCVLYKSPPEARKILNNTYSRFTALRLMPNNTFAMAEASPAAIAAVKLSRLGTEMVMMSSDTFSNANARSEPFAAAQCASIVGSPNPVGQSLKPVTVAASAAELAGTSSTCRARLIELDKLPAVATFSMRDFIRFCKYMRPSRKGCTGGCKARDYK